MKETVSIDEVIEYLNELAGLDREAIAKLIDSRVPCNNKIADHPTCQVQEEPDGIHVVTKVGILGVINGMFGVDKKGRGAIKADYFDVDGKFSSFIREKKNHA